MGGGSITGTTNDQTTKYIYLSGNVAVNEPVGEKAGLKLTVTFDYH
jgi:hypothetical protein